MKKLILSIILTISISIIFAQKDTCSHSRIPLNSINLNWLGNASFLSINYERVFPIEQHLFITGELGIGYNKTNWPVISGFGPEPDVQNCVTIPHQITANIGKGEKHFEVGLGGTIVSGKTNQNYFVYPIVGYRLQPLEPGLGNFRIFINVPVNGWLKSDLFILPLGIQIGFCF